MVTFTTAASVCAQLQVLADRVGSLVEEPDGCQVYTTSHFLTEVYHLTGDYVSRYLIKDVDSPDSRLQDICCRVWTRSFAVMLRDSDPEFESVLDDFYLTTLAELCLYSHILGRDGSIRVGPPRLPFHFGEVEIETVCEKYGLSAADALELVLEAAVYCVNLSLRVHHDPKQARVCWSPDGRLLPDACPDCEFRPLAEADLPDCLPPILEEDLPF